MSDIPAQTPAPWAQHPNSVPLAPAVAAAGSELTPPPVPPVEPTETPAPAVAEAQQPPVEPPAAPAVAAAEADHRIVVTVPKAFKLVLDHNTILQIPAGIQRMEKAVAEHWYSKANGVEIFEG